LQLSFLPIKIKKKGGTNIMYDPDPEPKTDAPAEETSDAVEETEEVETPTDTV